MRSSKMRCLQSYFLATCALTLVVVIFQCYFFQLQGTYRMPTGSALAEGYAFKKTLVHLTRADVPPDALTTQTAKVKVDEDKVKVIPSRDVIVQSVTHPALTRSPKRGKRIPKASIDGNRQGPGSDVIGKSPRGGADVIAALRKSGKSDLRVRVFNLKGTSFGYKISSGVHRPLPFLQAMKEPVPESHVEREATVGFHSRTYFKGARHHKVMLETWKPDGKATPTSGNKVNGFGIDSTSGLDLRPRGTLVRSQTKSRGHGSQAPVKTKATDKSGAMLHEEKVKEMTAEKKETWGNSGMDEEVALESTPRADNCLDCFRVQFPLQLAPSDLCNDLDPAATKLLVLIASAPKNVKARDVIRTTWGATCRNRKSPVRCAFLLGESLEAGVAARLHAEHVKHDDLVQHGFRDSYGNLTFKTLTSLQWALGACPLVDYVMKTDDDVYVNTELLPLMLRGAPRNGFAGGFCWGRSLPARDVTSKWYVSQQMYRGWTLPPVCSGTGYVLSVDVVERVLDASPRVPWFHLEDVYVAFCLQLNAILPRNIRGFSNEPVTFDPCRFRNEVVTSHSVTPETLARYWRQLRRCPADDVIRAESPEEIPLQNVPSWTLT